MLEFGGLRAKLYTFRLPNDSNTKEIVKKAKGVKGEITFQDYKNCLFENIDIYKTQRLIQSKKRMVNTVEQRKLALSSYDDKKILLSTTTDTIPWGYK